MGQSILITDGVPTTDGSRPLVVQHSSRRWAMATASHIIDISASADETKVKEAREFEAKIVDILDKHHALVQENESARLSDDPDGYASPLSEGVHLDTVDDCVSAIVAAAAPYGFAKFMSDTAVQADLAGLLKTHFSDSAAIERQRHADATAHPKAAAFMASIHGADALSATHAQFKGA